MVYYRHGVGVHRENEFRVRVITRCIDCINERIFNARALSTLQDSQNSHHSHVIIKISSCVCHESRNSILSNF